MDGYHLKPNTDHWIRDSFVGPTRQECNLAPAVRQLFPDWCRRDLHNLRLEDSVLVRVFTSNKTLNVLRDPGKVALPLWLRSCKWIKSIFER